MTPQARVAAAIEILDHILDGTPAEQALTGWARRSRFAGSKDRAAIRDHVFDVLRRKRSAAAMGGSRTGRGLMLGLLRQQGSDLSAIFDGVGHGPVRLSDAERAAGREPDRGAEASDLPDWLWPIFVGSLGDRADEIASALRERAPVFLRVNAGKTTPEGASDALMRDQIETELHPVVGTALVVRANARRIRQSKAYLAGLVDLQDASSQAVVSSLPLTDGQRVLDYCAGGGGKTLALAAQAELKLHAHDASPERMRDLPDRAARAGVEVRLIEEPAKAAPYDLVLCDVPCSGSGAWRRAPEGKWLLDASRLTELSRVQDDILRKASTCVSRNGLLAYATCSVLSCENEERIAGFLRDCPDWTCTFTQNWSVNREGDGFFVAHLMRK